MFILQSKSLTIHFASEIHIYGVHLWVYFIKIIACRSVIPCHITSYTQHTKANVDVEKLDQPQMAERWISGITKLALHTVLSVYRFLFL